MKKIERLGEYISEYSVRNKDNEDIQVYSKLSPLSRTF